MLLTEKELIDLTGKENVLDQIEWLKRRGWKFVMSSGVPKVDRRHYEQMLKTDLEKPDHLMSQKQIVDRSMQVERICGVYFLILGDEIVYIGQSQDVDRRISAHADKHYNRIYVIKAPQQDLLWLEAMYINKFKPRYNLTIPTGSFHPTLDVDRLKAIEDANI